MMTTLGDARSLIPGAVVVGEAALAFERVHTDTRTLRAGLYRAFRDDATGAAMAWGSWVDPGDDQVDFHRPQTFGRIHFAGRQ